MAASRMSRISSWRLAFLSPVVVAMMLVASVSSDSSAVESLDDVELITASRNGNEFVAIAGADGDSQVSASPSDLKKNSRSNEEMNVNVQPEGMSGIVNDGIAVDSDEKMIMEKKKNGTVDLSAIKPENDSSTEAEENVKINLDASHGVQNPSFNKQRGSITVPEQKQISLSKGAHKKTYDTSGYDVIPLTKQREKHHTDEGVFDFVDSPLSDKHLVPAGTGQTSRVNVKKGPNGQEYEYEYIYYYYEDGDEPAAGQKGGEKVPKGNEIPTSTNRPTQRTTTPFTRISSTSAPQFTQSFSENTNNHVKSTDILSETVSPSVHSSQQPSREKFRNDFRYNVDNSAAVSQQIPQNPTKNSAANEVYWQYDSSRFPGRQAQSQTFSEQPFVVPQDNIATTKQASRGRLHYNPATKSDDASYLVTASPISTQQPRETQTRSKSVTGTVRQPGLELVDSNSFRTHSTNVPVDYESPFSPAQTYDTPRGKSLKPSSPQQEFSTIAQTVPTSTIAPKIDTFKKDPTVEFVTSTDRFAPQQTISSRIAPISSTETIFGSNTAPLSTASDNSLTTVYGPGLTDKAAHDLYAIYQQTQNEETVRNTISQDDRTTLIDEPANSFIQTNPPATSIFTVASPAIITTTPTTTAAPTTTTTTTTTTPPPPPSTTTTATATIPSSPVPGRGRFRSSPNRNRFSLSTTESAQPADIAGDSSEKPRNRFQPTHRREPGHRVSAYGRRGFSSTSTTAPDGDSPSSTATVSNVETSTKPHAFSPSSRNRFRTSTARLEGASADSQSLSAPASRPNFADRYNSRRRPGLRTSTTTSPEQEDSSIKQEITSGNVESSSPSADQQSTTFRSIRNRFNNNRPQPLRPGAKLNFSPRGKIGGVSSSTSAAVPLDADTSGSADVPVEQQKEEISELPSNQDVINETTISISSTTTANTPHPDPLSRLKHRSKLRVSDKGGHSKINAQQANNTAVLNQNRRNLVHNLLPRKKQQSTSTEGQEVPVKEEKPDNGFKPVTEESQTQDEVSPPQLDADVSKSQSTAEASSTTESRLSSLIASRRHNLAGRRLGTLSRSNKQTANEES